MSYRVVAVTGPAGLRLQDRHLLIEKNGEAAGKVPLEDLAALVLDGPDLWLTHQLLALCVDLGVAVVTADEKHLPNGVLLPLAGHSLHSETLRAQIEASLPARKRAWQRIVRARIHAQADLVSYIGADDDPLRRLIPFVRSGDPDNLEATAAALAFPLVFGPDFVRQRDEPGVNAMLNYGYAIVRSAVARAVVGAGLHPALGVFHRNRYNPLCLADDAMEPFRTMVERVVWEVLREDAVPEALDPSTKRRLVTLLGEFVRIEGLRFPFLVGLERFAAGLRRAMCEGEELVVPLPDLGNR